MDTQRAAEIQVVLEGIALPATRDALVAYARQYDPAAAAQLAALPEREYGDIDEVGEALLGPRPAPVKAQRLPAPESGRPPGGDDYLNPRPVPGGVRRSAPEDNPAEKALEKQSKTQKRQAAVQQGKPLPGPIGTT